MPRTANSKKTTTPPTKGRKPGRPPATSAKPAAKVSKTGTAANRASLAKGPAPKVSKDDLRAQIEKLEQANATLRSKGRAASREAKVATARLKELEREVARLERQLQAARPVKREPAASPSSDSTQPVPHDIDPGDSVPPGVAVNDTAEPDLEAETARQNLEEHLGGDQ